MSDQMLRLIIGGVILVHGVGHGGAMAALAWVERFGAGSAGGWRAAHSWLMPSLAQPTPTLVACAFWTVSLAGFVVAALSFWGILPIEAWRPVAVVSALVSIAGIVCFLGTWPAFNTVAALAVNVAVLVAILALAWPPRSLA